jgi:hypothetical protein
MFSARTRRIHLLFIWLGTSIGLWFLVPLGSRDYTTYLEQYGVVIYSPVSELLMKDTLYSMIVYLFSSIGVGGSVFFFGLTSISFGLKSWAISRLSGRSAYALLIYASSYFFVHEFTQVRVSLALGIWLLGISYYKSNMSKYLILTALAALIHFQAAVGLFLPLLLSFVRMRYGKYLIVMLVTGILLTAPFYLFDRFGDFVINLIPDPRTEIYFAMRDVMGWVRPNPFSTIGLTSFCTMLLLLRQKPPDPALVQSLAAPDILAVILASGVISLVVFAPLSVAAFRVSEFFFSVLPVGIAQVMKQRTRLFQLVASVLISMVFVYIFVFHAPNLLNPATGAPNE